jgi:tRNA A37 threonylcarbamoyltransferase TsaD
MVGLPLLLLPVPLVAKLSAQPIAVRMALKDARISALDVDGIAFTRGPGKSFLSSLESACR